MQKDLSRSARMASSFWWTGCSAARLILIFSWTARLEPHFCNFTTSNPSVDNSGKLWSLSIPQWLCKAKNLSIRSQACILKIVCFLHSWAIFHCRDCSYAKALLYLRFPSRFASGKSCTYCLWPRWDYPSRNADSGLVSGVSIFCCMAPFAVRVNSNGKRSHDAILHGVRACIWTSSKLGNTVKPVSGLADYGCCPCFSIALFLL